MVRGGWVIIALKYSIRSKYLLTVPIDSDFPEVDILIVKLELTHVQFYALTL